MFLFILKCLLRHSESHYNQKEAVHRLLSQYTTVRKMTSIIVYMTSQIIHIMLYDKKQDHYKLTPINDVLWQNRNNLCFSMVYCVNNQQLGVPMLFVQSLGLNR